MKSDSSTLIKCLVIAAEMLRETKMKRLNPTLLTLLDTLVSCKMVLVYGSDSEKGLRIV